MDSAFTFSILDSVDSTNNYAMGQVHAGLAKHGMAWFAKDQTAGKGQRTKQWESEPGMNIIMSIALSVEDYDLSNTFMLNAAIAVCINEFLGQNTSDQFTIKWPNDIYWRDRKAGGILTENIIRGDKWLWSVVGIGINVNQVQFPVSLPNPVSLLQITGKYFDPVILAQALHFAILQAWGKSLGEVMNNYNTSLYKRNNTVKFRKEARVFHSRVDFVDQYGLLHLNNNLMEETFSFGDIEWMIE